MRQKELDIVGQEILTKDKIGIRMNVACMYKISDAVEFRNISSLESTWYGTSIKSSSPVISSIST